ncbi:SGNH hydrolase-type esterase domain-containing protein [Xylaria nigripes]|nr:SGNH hydrolase-type esterase domain-containing protein [Xylaria nigripes]
MVLLGYYRLLPALLLTLTFIGSFFLYKYNAIDYVDLRLLTGDLHAYAPKDDDGPVANGIPLRVMFLGASITRGEVSTGDRGYRKYIRDTLTSWGNPVNYVGFNRFGDWEDNDVEGYGAHRIRRIQPHAEQAVPVLQPNLILVQVGTSDCFQDDDPDNIGLRMLKLVDTLLSASPQATVIMSTLPTTPDPERETCVLSANTQIRQVATELMREEKTVALAEMHHNQGRPGRPGANNIGQDRIHPTDEGYIMMGNSFLEAIREVEGKGFLRPPVDNGIPDSGDDGREVEDRLREKAEAEHPIAKRARKQRFTS